MCIYDYTCRKFTHTHSVSQEYRITIHITILTTKYAVLMASSISLQELIVYTCTNILTYTLLIIH